MSLIHDTSTAIQALNQLNIFGLAAMICDTSGVVQLLNSAAAALFQQEPGYLEGQSVHEFEALAPLSKMIKDDTPQITPQKLQLFDHLYCLVRMQKIGRLGFLFIFDDISDLKAREDDQLATLNLVMHDLKAPLTAIKGNADLVQNSGPLNEKQQKYLDRLMRSVHIMDGMVRDILDMAWLDAEEPLVVEPINLTRLVQNAIDVLGSIAEEQQISIEYQLPDVLPDLEGDYRRLERVVVNLLANAIKYTEKGGKVSVQLWQEENQQIIRVSDTGIGIPSEYLPHIFKRFYRVPNQDKRTEGSGLGLAIVHTVVERHHGTIEVESEPGKGSTFTVRLPLRHTFAD
ncbi:MAG: hypothetical protein CUN55_07450 [Phototrophicales bacterium]|nr:MAG: hypothetical protein CUN55_07450 [Phototrophicales bacterium]